MHPLPRLLMRAGWLLLLGGLLANAGFGAPRAEEKALFKAIAGEYVFAKDEKNPSRLTDGRIVITAERYFQHRYSLNGARDFRFVGFVRWVSPLKTGEKPADGSEQLELEVSLDQASDTSPFYAWMKDGVVHTIGFVDAEGNYCKYVRVASR